MTPSRGCLRAVHPRGLRRDGVPRPAGGRAGPPADRARRPGRDLGLDAARPRRARRPARRGCRVLVDDGLRPRWSRRAGGVADLLATAEESVAVAARLGIPRLNLHGTGLDGDGLPVVPVEVVTDEMWDAARAHARQGGRARGGARGDLRPREPQPGGRPPRGCPSPRRPTASPSSRRSTARTCGSCSTSTTPRSARGTSWSSAAGRCRGSVRSRWPTCPGRCEPGTGEIAYPFVARALAEMGYTGTVGLEAWASGDPTEAVAAFRAAFTL